MERDNKISQNISGELSVIKKVEFDRRVKVTNYIEVGSENMQLGWIDFSKEDRQKPFIRVLAFSI